MSTTLKVSIHKATSSEYFGTVEIDGTEINIEGEFFVEWDDDIPQPTVEDVFLNLGPGNENLIQINNGLIELHISQELDDFACSDWYEDRASDLCSQAYDRYKDSYKYGDPDD